MRSVAGTGGRGGLIVQRLVGVGHRGVLSRAGERAPAMLDCAFLVIVVAISLLPYIRGLGFYYDDYSFLELLHSSPDQSLAGLYDAVRPSTGQRPLQAMTYAALYWIFGLQPLGYHVVNACLLAGVAIFLYLVLRELRLPRLVCVSIPLVYAVLPHYATTRFWLAAFQITVSTLLYLVSLYAGLRALRARPLPLVAWLTVAVVSVAGSLFAYEVVFPLFALEIALLWLRARRAGSTVRLARWLTIGGVAAAMLGFGIAKTMLVAEHGQGAYEIGVQDGVAHHLAYLVSGSLKVNLGTYFLALPYVLWWIVRHRLTVTDVGAALACGLLALAWLQSMARRDTRALADARLWRSSMLIGIAAFVLGYAIFLTNQRVLFRSAGIDNRVNAAAALGVAVVVVAGLGWIATRLPARRRVAFMSGAVSVGVAVSVLVVGSLAGYWTEAADRQRAAVQGLEQTGSLQSGTIVILDGICPEVGPAVVFGDEWDSRNAIRLAVGDSSLIADTATGVLQARAHRLALISTFLDRRSTRTYPYGTNLFVYDFPNRALRRMDDRASADRYVASRRPVVCQPQRGFAWGFDPFRRLSLA